MMRVKILLAAAILSVFAGSYLAKGLLGGAAHDPRCEVGQCRRIVSMAPSITETLFALELGDRVVGVTDFCKFPPLAQTRAKVGDAFHLNLEAVVALRADLVVMQVEHQQSYPQLGRLGINTLAVSQRDIDSVLDSFVTIGNALGKPRMAERIVADLHRRMRQVRAKTAGRPRPQVMMAIDRAPDAGRLEGVYIAGTDGYLDKIIEIAGGENVFRQQGHPFPMLAVEGIIHLDPDVIVDLVPNRADLGRSEESLRADWRQVPGVAAVRRGRVYVFDDDFGALPGPRFILFVEKLARVLHPEVDWDP
jgi:iron complex transport system substrate-binding protein